MINNVIMIYIWRYNIYNVMKSNEVMIYEMWENIMIMKNNDMWYNVVIYNMNV